MLIPIIVGLACGGAFYAASRGETAKAESDSKEREKARELELKAARESAVAEHVASENAKKAKMYDVLVRRNQAEE